MRERQAEVHILGEVHASLVATTKAHGSQASDPKPKVHLNVITDSKEHNIYVQATKY